MKDFTIVHVLQPEADLSEPVQDLVFTKMSVSLLFYQLLEISAVSEVHHDAEMALLSLVDFSECYYIRMVEYLQNLCLFHSIFPLPFRHRLNIYLLNDT
jgi:hypothetical protein